MIDFNINILSYYFTLKINVYLLEIKLFFDFLGLLNSRQQYHKIFNVLRPEATDAQKAYTVEKFKGWIKKNPPKRPEWAKGLFDRLNDTNSKDVMMKKQFSKGTECRI